MTGREDRWIRRTTVGCVALLALIAGTVSYLHMHTLVALHGQPGWVAALTPLSVDGMIVAASTTLLADSRSGVRGQLPAASLAQCVPSLSVIWRGPSWLHGHLAGTKPLGAGSLPLHIVVEPDESRRMTQKEAASIAVAG